MSDASVRTIIHSRRRIRIFCAVLLCLGGVTAAAGRPVLLRGTTGVLEGRVIDQQTAEPLVGVNVVLMGTAYGGATDAEGYYQVLNVRAGVYTVRFSFVGYRTITMTDVTILPDLRTRVDITLEPSTVELEAVEIRAERPLIQKDLAATAYAIGETRLEKLPISTFQEVLALQPGTTLEGNVRGGKTSEVVYLVDGMPVQDVLEGGFGVLLPRSSTAAMTIYTGGFEAEYGNAMSGVINVITKGGSDRPAFGIRYERDGWIPERWNQQQDRFSELEVSAGGPIELGKTYYFLSGNLIWTDTRWWQDFDRVLRSPVSSTANAFGKVDHVFASGSRISFQGLYALQEWRDYEFSWRFNLQGLPQRRNESYRGAALLTYAFSPHAFLNFSISAFSKQNRIGDGSKEELDLNPYQYDFFLRYIVSGDRNWWADTRQTIASVKADFTQELLRSHMIKVGAEFSQHNLEVDVTKFEPQRTYFGKPLVDAPLLNYSNTYTYHPRSGSVYVQDKVELVRDGSNVSFGVRWDFLDPRASRPLVEFIPVSATEYEQQVTGQAKARFKHQFSPRLSFAGPVGPSSFFFVNFGHYFQFPLFEYLYSGVNPAQLRSGVRNVLTGNPDLAPERSISWEMGFKHGISRDVVVSIAYFKKSFKNQIDSKTLIPADSKSAGDYGFASYVNNAEARAEGIEVILSSERKQPVSGNLSYTYMVTEGISEYVDQTLNYAQWGFPLAVKPFPLSWDQRHAAKADVQVRLPGEIDMNLVAVYSSPRPYTYYPTRDGFEPADPTKDFLPNNARMNEIFFLNVKVSRELRWGVDDAVRAVVFVDARNLLNRMNVRWMDSSGRVGGELGDPSAYYDPRRVRVGIKFEL